MFTHIWHVFILHFLWPVYLFNIPPAGLCLSRGQIHVPVHVRIESRSEFAGVRVCFFYFQSCRCPPLGVAVWTVLWFVMSLPCFHSINYTVQYITIDSIILLKLYRYICVCVFVCVLLLGWVQFMNQTGSLLSFLFQLDLLRLLDKWWNNTADFKLLLFRFTSISAVIKLEQQHDVL